ncbi:MAG: hypothetical protein AB7V43_11145 [Acidimicrobiia bacterium]
MGAEAGADDVGVAVDAGVAASDVGTTVDGALVGGTEFAETGGGVGVTAVAGGDVVVAPTVPLGSTATVGSTAVLVVSMGIDVDGDPAESAPVPSERWIITVTTTAAATTPRPAAATRAGAPNRPGGRAMARR